MIQTTVEFAKAKLSMSDIAVEILQSVGVELAIFLTTALVAIAFKGTLTRTGCRAGPVPSAPSGQSCKACKSNLKGASAVPAQKLQSGNRVRAMIDSIMSPYHRRCSSEVLSTYAKLRASGHHLQVRRLIESSTHSVDEFYNILVQCAIRADRPHLIDQIFGDMADTGVKRSLELYESTMKLLAGKKQYHQALAVYDLLQSEGLEPSAVTLSCLISFTAELGEYDRALKFFEQLAATDTPSIRACMTVLRVHGKRQDWPASKALLKDMQQRNVAIDSLVLNIVLATGVAAGKTIGTTALLNEFQNYADVISYNTVIKGYAHQKDVMMAREMLDLMVSRGLSPNAITYNTVMDAAVRRGQVDDAWQVLDQMCKVGIQPDKFSCTILVKGLHSSSTPKQLTTVVDILVQVLPRCEDILTGTVFRSIMEVAGRLRCLKLMLRVFDQLQEHIKPGIPEYQPLLQASLQQSDVQQAKAIWQRALSDPSLPCATLFAAVVDEFSRREQADCMINTFESLRSAVHVLAAAGGEKKLSQEGLIQQCHLALVRAASRKSKPGRGLQAQLSGRAPELFNMEAM